MTAHLATTVALCTFQGQRFIAAQWESLIRQTRRPQQIVVFDDASSDHTWQLLQELSEKASASGIPTVMHRQESNVGYVRNFQAALERSEGDLVFLCDQDDIWHPTKLSLMASEFEKRPDLLMLHTNARLIRENGEPEGRGLFHALEVTNDEIDAVHRGFAFEVLLRRNIVTGATMGIRRQVLNHALPVPAGWIHDEWLAIVAASRGAVDVLDRDTIDYRQHGGNQVGAARRNALEKIHGGKVSRGEYLERTRTRFETMLQRVNSGELPLRAQRRDLLLRRLDHARLRAALPGSRLKRLALVWREYRTGRYSQFSTGFRSALADALGSHW
jgi:glycosyltransferase involved in cell wall biosynthesis